MQSSNEIGFLLVRENKQEKKERRVARYSQEVKTKKKKSENGGGYKYSVRSVKLGKER